MTWRGTAPPATARPRWAWRRSSTRSSRRTPARQLAQASAHERVRYGVALAERSPLPDGSVDLVTVSQALHWLKLPSFYAEVRRVAKPGCVIACWCYSEMQVAPEIDPILFRLDNEILHDDWLPEHFEVARSYATLRSRSRNSPPARSG